MRAGLFLAGAFLLTAGIAACVAEPLSTFIWKDVGPPTMARPPVLFFRLGSFQGVLEKTTLKDVQRRFGGTIANNGKDAAGGEESICYVLHSPAGMQRLTFASNAEMGGGSITGLMVEPGSGCPEPSRPGIMLTLGGGIGIGMRAADLVSILGDPSVRSGDPLHGEGQMSFSYYKPVSPDDPALGARSSTLRENGFSVSDQLQVNLSGGQVLSFAATRVTSN